MSKYKSLSFVLFGHFLFNQTINNFILDIPVKLITFDQKRRVVIMKILINVSFLFSTFSFKINKNIHFFHDILVNLFFVIRKKKFYASKCTFKPNLCYLFCRFFLQIKHCYWKSRIPRPSSYFYKFFEFRIR